MRSGRHKYACIALLLVCSSAFGKNLYDILELAEEAESRLSYRGVKQASVHSGIGKAVSATMKVVHLKPDKTRTEYLTPSALAGIVLVRTSRGTYRYDPRRKLWEAIGRCPVDCDDELSENLRHHYRVQLLGVQQVAGRDAYLIAADPKRRGEPSHRFWIDKDSCVVVGAETKASDGTVLRSYRFISLELNPKDIRPSLFDINASSVNTTGSATRLGFRVMKPSYLPSGYKLVGARTSRINGLPCSHLRFSNGVNTISLFQRRARNGSNHREYLCRATNVVTWSKDGMLFTLLGDLSRPELEKIARSVR